MSEVKTEVNYDRLYIALCRYWKPVTKKEFWLDMDMVDTREAVNFIPEDVWKKYVTKTVTKQICIGKMRRF